MVAEEFARKELLQESETLHRVEEQGPFVAALVELEKGGFVIRVAQPQVILRGRHTKLPLVSQIGPWGARKYPEAARRFDLLVDEQL